MSKWNKYTATKDWNNAFNRSGQPDLGGVINKGKTEEIKPDESGLIRTGYKTTSTEKELQDTSDEIRRYITRNNNRDLGVEVAKDEVYQYAVNNRIEAEDLELAPPDGCGMKPLYEDVDHPTDIEKFNMSRWENAVKQLDKDTTIRHKEYRQDMRNMISNKALIDLIRRGKVSTGVTRHIAAKYYYAKDLIAEGLIALRHCPTRLMIADILTKHLGGPDFKKMSNRLRNTIEQDETLSDEVYKRLYMNSTENVYKDEDNKVIKLLSMVISYLKEGQP
jgi:hypothetical protein